MNFQFSEELKMIALSARDFAEQYIRPHIMDWDQRQHFPREVLEKAGEMGFMGIFIPEKYGGSGLGYHEYVTIIKEISKFIKEKYSGPNLLFLNVIISIKTKKGPKGAIAGVQTVL